MKRKVLLTDLYIEKERAEPVNSWRRLWKTSLYLDLISKNSPAYLAWNVKKALITTQDLRFSISIKALRHYLKVSGKGDTYS